jgi:hypothetical protein
MDLAFIFDSNPQGQFDLYGEVARSRSRVCQPSIPPGDACVVQVLIARKVQNPLIL